MIEHTETTDGVTYDLIIHPEDIPPEGHASAIDPETDREVLEWIYSELDAGNMLAWCTVECRASYGPFSTSDYLGACSYASLADFLDPQGYWPGMKHEALRQLAREIGVARDSLADLPQAILDSLA